MTTITNKIRDCFDPNGALARNRTADLICAILKWVYVEAAEHFDGEAQRRGITKEALAAAAIAQGLMDLARTGANHE